jgi:hypothetical protein
MPKRSSQLFGDWEKAGRWLTEKKSTFKTWGDEPLKECADLYYKNLINGIQNQKFKWKKLSTVYLQRKIANGYPALILIATGSYIDGIKIHKATNSKNEHSMFVGADNEAIHEPSGLPMSYLGAIHEYGTRDGRIPARPHYRPAWEKTRNQARKIWLRSFNKYGRVR